jgi:general stress protein 26
MADTVTWAELTSHMTGLAHLATASADGGPRVAVVSAVAHESGILLSTFRSSAKARNMAENPRASIMWTPGPELYVQTTAELLHDAETKHWLWNSGLLPYNPADFFGTADNPEMVVVKLTPVSAVVMVMGEGPPQSRRWRA